MDLGNILNSLKNCPCGREHTVNIKAIEIGSGIMTETANILKNNGFPQKLLVVADKNTLTASKGILNILTSGGFSIKTKIYDNLRTADIEHANEITLLAQDCEAILSIGTGSLNDICRLAALNADKELAIFATAPSMDGFASGTSPITFGSFKKSVPARQPSVIIADTKILAASPAELKSAGFGDIIGKYIALVDWRVSALVTGEYYCERIANITRDALSRIAALAGKVTQNNEESAGAIMETLVLTGLAMKLCDSVRPASGAEHMISHYWEMKKLEKGLISDYHGKKVGVATVLVAKKYHEIAAAESPSFHEDRTDWAKVYETLGKNFEDEVRKLNTPTVTDETSPETLSKSWQQIRKIIAEELPDYSTLLSLMKAAGAATKASQIAVSPELCEEGLAYHPYLRHRMTLTRLFPMINLYTSEL